MKTPRVRTVIALVISAAPTLAGWAQQPASPPESASVSALLRAASSREDSLRDPAKREIRRRGAALVPVLDSMLHASRGELREAAAAALIEIGPPALPAIRRAVRDTGMLASYVSEALSAAMMADSTAILLAIPLLSDSSPTARANVVGALPTYRGDVGRAGALALTALADPDAKVREAAAYKVLEVHDSLTALRAIPRLVVLLADSSAIVRRQAVYSLGNMGPLDSAQIGGIVRRMQTDPDTAIRILAARVLGWHGSEASSAVPALLASVDDPLRSVRTESLGSLGGIGVSRLVPPLADSVIAVLRAHLTSPDSAWRAIAVAGLARIGAPAVAALSQALASPDSLVAAAAADGMALLATDSAVIRPLLLALGDPRANVRRAAANALGGLDIDVSKLLQIAADSSTVPRAREAARRALHVRAVAESLPIARRCYALEYGKWDIPDSVKSQEWGRSPAHLRFGTVVTRWHRGRDSLAFTVQQRWGDAWVGTGYWEPDAAHHEVTLDASPEFSGKWLKLHVESNGELHGWIETYWDFTPSTTQRAPVVARPIDCGTGKPITPRPAKSAPRRGAP